MTRPPRALAPVVAAPMAWSRDPSAGALRGVWESLTALTPTSADVMQELGLHEADVPVRPTTTASADVTGTATHTIDRVGGWPRTGRAEGRLETTTDSSAAQDDASADPPVIVLITGSVAAAQTYDRLL